MKKVLVWIFNTRFYPVLVGTIGAVITLFLANNGVSGVDVAVLVVYLLAAYALWRYLLTPQRGPDTEAVIRDIVRNGNQPTLIEFYSSYCVGCMAIKPVVDQLETEAGNRLNILRLNIDTEPESLKQEHNVVFTPTFVYFDAKGRKISDSIFVIDKAKILYDLDQA